MIARRSVTVALTPSIRKEGHLTYRQTVATAVGDVLRISALQMMQRALKRDVQRAVNAERKASLQFATAAAVARQPSPKAAKSSKAASIFLAPKALPFAAAS